MNWRRVQVRDAPGATRVTLHLAAPAGGLGLRGLWARAANAFDINCVSPTVWALSHSVNGPAP